MVWPWLALLGGAAIVNAVRYAWSGSDSPPPKRKRGRPPKIGAVRGERPTDQPILDESAFDQPQATYFPNFKTLAEQIAVPLHEEAVEDTCLHFGWPEFRAKPLYWFDRDGVTWEMNGDTRLWPVMSAYLWQKGHDDQDPFIVRAGGGKRMTLELRPEIGWTGPKHIYIYETVNPIPPKWSSVG